MWARGQRRRLLHHRRRLQRVLMIDGYLNIDLMEGSNLAGNGIQAFCTLMTELAQSPSVELPFDG